MSERQGKYGVSSAERRTYRGREYASMAECRYAQDLDLKESAGLIRSWLPQPPALVLLGGPPDRRITLRPDFLVEGIGGSRWYVEVKGYPTPEWKLKLKLFRRFGLDRLCVVTLDGAEEWIQGGAG